MLTPLTDGTSELPPIRLPSPEATLCGGVDWNAQGTFAQYWKTEHPYGSTDGTRMRRHSHCRRRPLGLKIPTQKWQLRSTVFPIGQIANSVSRRLAPSPTGLLHIGHARTSRVAARRAIEDQEL